MFHSSKVNVKVNHIHKRAQRIVYTTQKIIGSFLWILSHLLKKSLMENLIFLQYYNGNILLFEELLKGDNFTRTRVNASNSGINTMKYLAAKVWDIVSYDIKSPEIPELFKKKIRT